MSSFGDLNRVNTNIQSLDSQLSLNRINKNLAENQMRLSTGLRINRAEDDAAGFSIATKLNSRIAGLEQAMANVGDAKSVLDIAESSFDTVMDNLIEMKALATQAANDTLGAEERGFIAEQIKALGTDINEIANQTVFQDFELLNGAGGSFEGDLSLTFQVGERAADTLTADLSAVNVNQLFEGSTAAYDGTDVAVSAASFAGATGTGNAIESVDINGETVTFTDDATDITATASASELAAIAEQINAADIAGVSVAVNDDEDGLVFTNANTTEGTVEFNTGSEETLGEATASVAGQGEMNMTGWTSDDFRSFIGDIDGAISSMSERVNNIGIAQSSLSVREGTLSQSISANSSAVSRIMDADFAKEQSESVRLQILQQTATSALAQANFGPQSVLGFLG